MASVARGCTRSAERVRDFARVACVRALHKGRLDVVGRARGHSSFIDEDEQILEGAVWEKRKR